jgi:molybdopterin-guanine dinucleotide biosynthesis protein A
MAGAGITGALLAGGASRRMGRDKRLILIDGVPMARRAAGALASVTDELLIVAPAARRLEERLFDGLDAGMVTDERTDAGPLAGLEAALAAARHDLVLVAAADMPWLAPALLRHLAERLAAAASGTGAVAAGGAHGPEPMLACYQRAALPTVRRLLDGGERRMTTLLGVLGAEIVPPAAWAGLDPSGRSPVNVNVPADLERSA